jgi:hypothetical protein
MLASNHTLLDNQALCILLLLSDIVANRDYHSLSHLEIHSAKRISQHLSASAQSSALFLLDSPKLNHPQTRARRSAPIQRRRRLVFTEERYDGGFVEMGAEEQVVSWSACGTMRRALSGLRAASYMRFAFCGVQILSSSPAMNRIGRG